MAASPETVAYLAQRVVLSGALSDFHSDLLSFTNPLTESLAEAYFSDRYPGFDLEDADWPQFRTELGQVNLLLETVKARVWGNSQELESLSRGRAPMRTCKRLARRTEHG